MFILYGGIFKWVFFGFKEVILGILLGCILLVFFVLWYGGLLLEYFWWDWCVLFEFDCMVIVYDGIFIWSIFGFKGVILGKVLRFNFLGLFVW